MLVPGEFLTCPVPPEMSRTTVSPRVEAEHTTQEIRITVKITVIEEAERPSFLLILLRAFGAVHT